MKLPPHARAVVCTLGWMMTLTLPGRCETWIFNDGTRKEGDFVRFSESHLFIRQNDTVVSIPRESLTQAAIDLAKTASRGIRMDFVKIAQGRYHLGVHKDKLSGPQKYISFIREDMPFRTAVITRPFEIKATEVTMAEWDMVRGFAKDHQYTDIVAGRNGYRGPDEGTHPVTEVSWWDAVKWCNLLSELERRKPCYYSSQSFTKETVLRSGETGKIHVDWDATGYRLPTEAEWEAAWFAKGIAKDHPEPDGWHQENSEGNTHPVASRPSATEKPLHDMLGNVAEWCWDWKGPVVPTGSDKDPRGPETGPHRIFRGGSWADDQRICCQGGYRGDFSPIIPRSVFVGFRPIRPDLNPPASR